MAGQFAWCLKRFDVNEFAAEFVADGRAAAGDRFRTRPTLADPVGGKIDDRALSEAAEALVDGMAANLATIEAARTALGQILGVLSVSSDHPAAEALSILSGAERG